MFDRIEPMMAAASVSVKTVASGFVVSATAPDGDRVDRDHLVRALDRDEHDQQNDPAY